MSATEAALRDALEGAKETIKEQEAMLEQLTAEPHSLGTVRQVQPDGVFVLNDKGTSRLSVPAHLDALSTGDLVALSPQTGQIVDKIEGLTVLGDIAIVKDRKGQDLIEIDLAGNQRFALFNPDSHDPKKGDRIILDQTGTVLLHNFGKEQTRFNLDNRSEITWDDIGGLEDAKAELREALENPLEYPEVYEHYGLVPAKGILLYGPPGCGKTLLGKAAANAILQILQKHGQDVEEDANPFMYVKGPEILEKYVGVAEQTIRSMFARARAYKDKYGHPCVLFIDEADSILAKRGSGVSSDMEKTIVPMFLSEMDGLDENAAFVILATNRADTLDPAVLRDGRIDRKVKIDRPTLATAAEIFAVHLRGIPFAGKLNELTVAQNAASEMFSEKASLYNVNMKDGSTRPFTLGNITNGAMIAGIVQQARSFAVQRDLQCGKDKRSGVSANDVSEAIAYIAHQNRELEYKEDVKEWMTPFKDQVGSVTKVKVA